MKTGSSNVRLVARRAGVSATTVSRVLNNSPIPTADTRQRVWKAVEELNYQPNLLLSQAFRRPRRDPTANEGANHTIGFYMTPPILEKAQHGDGYYSRVLAGIQTAAQGDHYLLMCETGRRDALTLPDMVNEQRVDGLVIEGDFSAAMLKFLVQRLPVVFIDRTHPELPASSVMPNIEHAVREQLDYLWELGHRRIITFQAQSPNPQVEAYLRAFRAFLAGKRADVLHADFCEPCAITPETHAQVMADFARRLAAATPRPTALITWDVYACALLAELPKSGVQVPRDMSVMGMDDWVEARLATPQLTSYRFPMDEMGRSATELLIQRIQDRSRPPRHLLIDGCLIERASCAAAPSEDAQGATPPKHLVLQP